MLKCSLDESDTPDKNIREYRIQKYVQNLSNKIRQSRKKWTMETGNQHKEKQVEASGGAETDLTSYLFIYLLKAYFRSLNRFD